MPGSLLMVMARRHLTRLQGIALAAAQSARQRVTETTSEKINSSVNPARKKCLLF
jgi:hypothetical protein